MHELPLSYVLLLGLQLLQAPAFTSQVRQTGLHGEQTATPVSKKPKLQTHAPWTGMTFLLVGIIPSMVLQVRHPVEESQVSHCELQVMHGPNGDGEVPAGHTHSPFAFTVLP